MCQRRGAGQEELWGDLMRESMDEYLQPTPTIECRHPEIIAYAGQRARGASSDIEKAVKLYYAVRDEIRYDPYCAVLSIEGLKATRTLALGVGWCVPKAILLAACCRALGVPARLGYADVRNHLATARMRERMGTEIYYWHGYTSIFLENKWVKATPAFNLGMCERFGLLPLDFDGREDSIFQPFDAAGERHMEYVRDRGEHADVPLASIRETFAEVYAHLDMSGARQDAAEPGGKADFEAELEQEARGRAARGS
jgi:transglutaminase-like putative cysteine protease